MEVNNLGQIMEDNSNSEILPICEMFVESKANEYYFPLISIMRLNTYSNHYDVNSALSLREFFGFTPLLQANIINSVNGYYKLTQNTMFRVNCCIKMNFSTKLHAILGISIPGKDVCKPFQDLIIYVC